MGHTYALDYSNIWECFNKGKNSSFELCWSCIIIHNCPENSINYNIQSNTNAGKASEISLNAYFIYFICIMFTP